MGEDFKAVAALYDPLSDSAPAGEALENYHFTELQSTAAWERRDTGGPDPQKPPVFAKLRTQALGFLEKRTRDVRPLGRLVLAETGLSGCDGLARGMDLSAHWLVEHWDAVHPQDTENDGEFYERMEILSEQFSVVPLRMALEMAPLFAIPGLGNASLRTLSIAKGDAVAREDDVVIPPDSLKQVLVQHTESAEALQRAVTALTHVRDRADAVDAFLEDKEDVYEVDGFRRTVLAALRSLCDEAIATVAVFQEGGASPDPASEGPGDTAESGAGPDAASAPAAPGAQQGQSTPMAGPKTQEEAVALMDAIIRYYARAGRSSPIPIALIALRDLMEADFNVWVTQTARNGMEGAALDISKVEQGRLNEFLEAGDEDDRSDDEDDEEEGADHGRAPRIRDRESVKRGLDMVATFFAREEPSSPAPAYLRQLKALVDASFRDIMNIMVEDGEDPRLPLK